MVGIDRGVAVSAALSTGDLLHAPGLTAQERNAAKNIAAGHAVTARGGDGITRPANREPHLLLQSA